MSRIMLAVLTPPGASALAVVALQGAGVWAWVRGLFVRAGGGPLPESPGTPNHFLAKLSVADGLAEEVVVASLPADDGEWVEVHAHGGILAVRQLCDHLVAAGAVEASADDFPHRVAVADPRAWPMLLRAPTVRTASILLDQVDGAYLRVEHDPATQSRLAALSGVGRHLVTPWRVAVAGPPNVGKSSLVNALSGYTRSVVSPTAGTTRDVVRTRLAFGGWPVELIDTAGLRDGAGELENLGISRTVTTLSRAELVLWVLDVSGESPADVPAELLAGAVPVRRIANKSDAATAPLVGYDAVVSARTGDGIAGLAAAVARWLVPVSPEPGEGVPFPLDPECGKLSAVP